jgi:hypothetical protein
MNDSARKFNISSPHQSDVYKTLICDNNNLSDKLKIMCCVALFTD